MKKIILQQVAALTTGSSDWVNAINSEDDEAFLEQLQDRTRTRESEMEAKLKAAQKETLGARLKTDALITALEKGVNLGNPSSDLNLHRNRVVTLLSSPNLNPDGWTEEKGERYPVDENGLRRQDSNFHPMTMGDIIEQLNVFGTATSEPTASKKQTSASYMEQRANLLDRGRKKEAAELADRYLASKGM